MSALTGRAADISQILSDYDFLFTEDRRTVKSKIDANESNVGNPGKKKVKRLEIVVPRFVSIRTPTDGLELKNGFGYISIQERWIDGELIEYVYRFNSSHYTCLTEFKVTGDINEEPLNLHYDLSPAHEGPHLSVLYPSIRYKTPKIDVRGFLEFIIKHFDPRIPSTAAASVIWENRV